MRLITCFLILFIPGLVFADTTINIISDQGEATVYVKNQKVAFKSNDDKNTEAIFVPAESSLYIIDHQNSSYSVINEAKIAQLNQTIGSAMNALEQQLQNLPPEQREQMKQMMGGFGMNMPEPAAAKPPQKLVATGNKNYSGISCSENNIMEAEQSIGKICISNGNNLGLSTQDYNTLLQAQRFMFSLAQKAGELANRFQHTIPNIDGSTFNGLIVAGENTDKEELNTFKISSIKQEADQNSTDIPADYTEQKLPSPMM